MAETVYVKGLSDLQRFLDQLPAKLERNVMRGALRAGAVKMLEAAKSYVPVSTPNARNISLYGAYTGALRDSLRVSVRVKAGKVTASVKAGGTTKRGADVFYAQWVEYGTRAHWITIKGASKGAVGTFNDMANRGRLRIGENFVGESVAHPGAQPRPFMRPALDTQSTASVVAAGEYIKRRLASKHGIDTSEVIIEAEEGQP